MGRTVTALAAVVAMAFSPLLLATAANALVVEPTRIEIWTMRVFVASRGLITERWALQHSTRERCENLRPSVMQSFLMDAAPLCLPEMVSPEEFKEVLEHEQKATERPERGT